MWFKTGAARVGDGVCARVRPAVSGGGPSVAGAHGRQAGSEVWQWQGVVAVAGDCGSCSGLQSAAACTPAYASIDVYACVHVLLLN